MVECHEKTPLRGPAEAFFCAADSTVRADSGKGVAWQT